MRQENGHSLQHLICGGLAGMAAKTVVAPLDRIKIHFQVQNPMMTSFEGNIGGLFRALRQIYLNDGIAGLYRGHSAMLLRIFPYAAVNFTAYEKFKMMVYDGHAVDQMIWWKRIVPGALAGMTAVACTYPLDITRVRLAYNLNLNGSSLSRKLRNRPKFFSVWRQLFLDGKRNYGIGIFGLYQGLLPTLLGIIPYAGVSFATFETVKALYCKVMQSDEPVPVHAKFVIGLMAGLTAQTVSYPLDVIRRRAQVMRVAPHLMEIHRSTSPGEILTSLFHRSGWRAFFRGLSINYIKVAPATGVSFAMYETLKEHVFITTDR